MDKLTRLTKIRERFYALNGVALPCLLGVSRVEISETVIQETQTALREMNDCLANDEGEESFAPSISVENQELGESMKSSDFLLSTKEKRELNRDVLVFRLTHPQISRFPLLII